MTDTKIKTGRVLYTYYPEHGKGKRRKARGVILSHDENGVLIADDYRNGEPRKLSLRKCSNLFTRSKLNYRLRQLLGLAH